MGFLFKQKSNDKEGKISSQTFNSDVYFKDVANFYHLMGDDEFVIRVGDEEIAVGNEGKKLIALYIAASMPGTDEIVMNRINSFPALKTFYSTFINCATGSVARDDAARDAAVSGIISQNFSDLLNDRENKFCRMRKYDVPALIAMQTMRVAEANEVNPLYWICKTSDIVNDTNFSEEFVDNISWIYNEAVTRRCLVAKKPLNHSNIEEMVSSEYNSSEATLDVRLKEFDKKEEKRKLDEAEQRKKSAEKIAAIERDGRETRAVYERTINQPLARKMENVARALGINLYQSSSDTTGFRPGTSDLGEMGKMFGDKSIGDTSKSDDKGRHL